IPQGAWPKKRETGALRECQKKLATAEKCRSRRKRVMNFSRTMKISASVAAVAAGTGFSGTALANDDVVALSADPGNVVMPSISYNGWNYSTLDQITLDNVNDLQV